MSLQCTECGKIVPPLCCHTCRPSGNTLRGVVVPRELWERMRSAIFRIAMGREVCAGSPAYDPGLCDKAAVDKLVEDIQRHNDPAHRTPGAGSTKEDRP